MRQLPDTRSRPAPRDAARRLLVPVLLAAVVSALPVLADVVVMQDGSRLVGNVQRMGDGKLIVETQFAGTLEIDATKVQSFETDKKVNVGMTTGDKLIGTIDWQPDVNTGMIKTELGDLPFQIDKVSAIWPEGEKSPEELTLELKLKEAEEEYLAKLPKWALLGEIGLLFQEGNRERLNARGGLELSRTSDKDSLKFYVKGEYAEESKRRSASEVKLGSAYEYNITERWFAYARGELEYDEFENLDLRATLAGGAGYYWLKEEKHEFKTRVGAGYRHETYSNGRTSDEPILDLGADYRLDINDWLRFTHAFTYSPSFDDFGDYRLVADNALWIPIGDGTKWQIKLGALYEYDAKPNAGIERLDQTYYANLVLSLKE